MNHNKAHVTLENVIALSRLIAAKHGISENDAMELAEFNLNYASNYKEAASRV